MFRHSVPDIHRDLGEIRYHAYMMLLRHVCLRRTQVTRVRSRERLRLTQVRFGRSREDPKGNIATLRWNDFSSNGNSVT